MEEMTAPSSPPSWLTPVLLCMFCACFPHVLFAEGGFLSVEPPSPSAMQYEALASNECQGQVSKEFVGPYRFDGPYLCDTQERIETRFDVVVGSQGEVTFRSPSTTLGQFFEVERGGRFSIQANPLSDNLNRGLQGYLLVSRYGVDKKVDIATGQWSEIPTIKNWVDQHKDSIYNLYDLHSSLTYFTKNGRFALKVISNYNHAFLDGDAKLYVVTFDLANSSVVSEFIITPPTGWDYFAESIALSEDGQHIALLINDDEDYILRIYDLAGNRVSGTFYSYFLEGSFVKVDGLQWLPDGRLIFGYGRFIARTVSPYTTVAETFKQFPNPQEPIGLNVSPDGTKIAYALKTKEMLTLIATIWIMNIDGTQERQIVGGPKSNPDEELPMNYPVWSEDGKWVLFEFGSVAGYGGENPGIIGARLAVPSNSIMEPVGLGEGEISSKIITVKSFWDYQKANGVNIIVSSQTLQSSFPPGSTVAWILP